MLCLKSLQTSYLLRHSNQVLWVPKYNHKKFNNALATMTEHCTDALVSTFVQLAKYIN